MCFYLFFFVFVCSIDPIKASFLSHSLFCSYWCMHVVGFKFGWDNFLHNECIFNLTKLLSMAILYLEQHMLIANFPIVFANGCWTKWHLILPTSKKWRKRWWVLPSIVSKKTIHVGSTYTHDQNNCSKIDYFIYWIYQSGIIAVYILCIFWLWNLGLCIACMVSGLQSRFVSFTLGSAASLSWEILDKWIDSLWGDELTRMSPFHFFFSFFLIVSLMC